MRAECGSRLGERRGFGQERTYPPGGLWNDRHIARFGAASAVELPDAIDRVVVVERQQQPVTGLEGVRLTNQLESVAGIRCEHDGVDVWGSIEESEHPTTACVDKLGGSHRWRIVRVRITKDPSPEKLSMAPSWETAYSPAPV